MSEVQQQLQQQQHLNMLRNSGAFESPSAGQSSAAGSESWGYENFGPGPLSGEMADLLKTQGGILSLIPIKSKEDSLFFQQITPVLGKFGEKVPFTPLAAILQRKIAGGPLSMGQGGGGG